MQNKSLSIQENYNLSSSKDITLNKINDAIKHGEKSKMA